MYSFTPASHSLHILYLSIWDTVIPNDALLTIYAPIYMAPCVIVLMRADTLCGEVGEGGGLALEIESFLGPLKWHEPIGECHLEPKKLKISRAQPPPTSPSNGSARIKTFKLRAV